MEERAVNYAAYCHFTLLSIATSIRAMKSQMETAGDVQRHALMVTLNIITPLLHSVDYPRPLAYYVAIDKEYVGCNFFQKKSLKCSEAQRRYY